MSYAVLHTLSGRISSIGAPAKVEHLIIAPGTYSNGQFCTPVLKCKKLCLNRSHISAKALFLDCQVSSSLEWHIVSYISAMAYHLLSSLLSLNNFFIRLPKSQHFGQLISWQVQRWQYNVLNLRFTCEGEIKIMTLSDWVGVR